MIETFIHRAVRASYAQLPEMSANFPLPACDGVASSGFDQIVGAASVPGQWQRGGQHRLATGYAQHLQAQHDAQKQEEDRSTKRAQSRAQSNNRKRSNSQRGGAGRGQCAPDSDNEDVDFEAESRALTPEKGTGVEEDNSITPPGKGTLGEDFGFNIGSACETIKPKCSNTARFIHSPTSTDSEVTPDRGDRVRDETPSTTPEKDQKIAEPTDLCHLFEECSTGSACQTAIDMKEHLSHISGATAADYYEHALKEKKVLVSSFSAEQVVRLVLWYDLQQENITKEQIAMELSLIPGGRACESAAVGGWCSRMRQYHPTPRGPKVEEDKRRRERAATQAGLRALNAQRLHKLGKNCGKGGYKESGTYELYGMTLQAVPYVANDNDRDNLREKFAKRSRLDGGPSAGVEKKPSSECVPQPPRPYEALSYSEVLRY